MINYRNIPIMYFDRISQRTMSSSTGHSRNTVSDIIQHAQKKEVKSLSDVMTNQWLEKFLFPEKQAIEKGYSPIDWEIMCIKN